MSIKQLDRCWRFSKAKGGYLLVLLGIADFTNDEGITYPSIRTLAQKARLTPRNTQRAIRHLVATRELLLEEGKGPYRTHLYRIILSEEAMVEGCRNVRVTKGQDDICNKGRMTFQPYNPSEETVIKREIRGCDKASPSGPKTEIDPLAPETIHARWNSIPCVKPCKTLGPTIRNRIQNRIKEHPDATWWDNLLQQIRESDFLCGRIAGNDGYFHPTLDWVLGSKNLDKILAGNYDNVLPSSQKGAGGCQWKVEDGDGRNQRPCGKPFSAGEARPFCNEHRKERDRLDTQLSKGAP
jgi:hypothetical protein